MVIVEVNHTSFTVSDLDRSLGFYIDVLGMTLIDVAERSQEFSEKVTGIPKAHLKIAYLDAWGHKLELIQYLSPRGRKDELRTCDIGCAHLAFNVTNLNDLYHGLKTRVRFKSEPQVIPVGPNENGLCVYLTDPDGITLEFIQQS